MSISSDEGHAKVVHVHDGSNARGGKNKGKKAKAGLSAEEKKELKEKNGKVVKVAKKAMKELEPVVKSCNKLLKSKAVDQAFQDQVWAAKKLLQAARKIETQSKEKLEKELSFDSNEEGIKDLKKSLEGKITAIQQLESMLAGGIDEEHLEKIAGMVKQRKQDKANAVDVS